MIVWIAFGSAIALVVIALAINAIDDSRWGGVAGFLLVVALFTAFFTGLVFGINSLDRANCVARAHQMGVPAHFGVFSDCQVKIGDHWIPLDNYRGVTHP